MLTVEQASEASRADGAKGYSVSQLRREIKEGKLLAIRKRGALRIADDVFAEYLRSAS